MINILNLTELEIRNNIESFTSEQLTELLTNKQLSEQFLRDYNTLFTKYNLWPIISQYQKLSNAFLSDYCKKIDWTRINSQSVTCSFLDSLVKLSIREKISVKIKGALNNFSDAQLNEIWIGLKYNEFAKLKNKPEINVLSYASSKKTPEEMRNMRLSLINELQPQIKTEDNLDSIIENKPQKANGYDKHKRKPFKTRFGTVNVTPDGIYEYPEKEVEEYKNSDNCFGDYNIFSN